MTLRLTTPITIRVTLCIAVNIKKVNYYDTAFLRPKEEVRFQGKSK